LVLLCPCAAGAAQARDYPARPLRLIVPLFSSAVTMLPQAKAGKLV